jgi:hypothetical protein
MDYLSVAGGTLCPCSGRFYELALRDAAGQQAHGLQSVG